MAIEINCDDTFKPRPYQQEIFNALHAGYRKLLICLPRRCGKDLTVWNYAYERAVQDTCFIYYSLPTAALARSVIWDGMTNEGVRLLDMIDPRCLVARNEAQMKLTFWNGS